MLPSDPIGSPPATGFAPAPPASRAARGPCMAAFLLLLTAACGAAEGPARSPGETPPAAMDAPATPPREAEPSLAEDPAPLIPAEDPSPPPETPDHRAGDRKLDLCRDLQAPLAQALGLEAAALALQPADVTFPEWGNQLDGCRLSWKGPGLSLRWEQTSSQLPTTRAMRSLIEAGWEEDKAHGEDHPGSFARIYVQGLRLCRLDVAFSPPPGQACAGQDPVTCGLGPAQLDYRIALGCADG